MNADALTLTDAALALPQAQRADLAEVLISSLDLDEQTRIDTAWKAEIARRRNSLRLGESTPIPGEQVLRELMSPVASEPPR